MTGDGSDFLAAVRDAEDALRGLFEPAPLQRSFPDITDDAFITSLVI